MLSVSKSEVPVYLRTSELYVSLFGAAEQHTSDNETVTVPAKYCKVDEIIRSIDDLFHLANTLRYWGVLGIPSSVMEYAFSDQHDETSGWSAVLAEFGNELIYLKDIASIRQLQKLSRMEAAIWSGWFEIVEYLYCQNYTVPKNVCTTACAAGNKKCLEYFHSRGYCLSAKCSLLACEAGSVDCLVFLDSVGQAINQNVCDRAAELGHADCLSFCISKLKVQKKNKIHKAFALAVKNGRLSCLRVFIEHEIPIDRDAGELAAQFGHLDCLQYLLETCNIELTGSLIVGSARGNSIACIAYLHRYGYPWTVDVAGICSSEGSLVCLMYVHENGGPWDEYVTASAAEGGHLDCLQYAHEMGCPWDETACIASVKGGKLDCLKYLVENGCPIGDSIGFHVRSLQILEYLHLHGMKWSPHICVHAVIDNCLERLQYATEHGCPWADLDNEVCVCRFERESGSISHELREYVRERRCPCTGPIQEKN